MDVDEHYDDDDEDAPIRAPGRKRKGKSNNLVKSAYVTSSLTSLPEKPTDASAAFRREFIDSEEED